VDDALLSRMIDLLSDHGLAAEVEGEL